MRITALRMPTKSLANIFRRHGVGFVLREAIPYLRYRATEVERADPTMAGWYRYLADDLDEALRKTTTLRFQ